MLLEWTIVITLLAAAGYAVFGRLPSWRGQVAILLFVGLGLLGGWFWQRHLDQKIVSRAQLVTPHQGRPDGFASSDSCRSCHPGQYSTWHDSFHRTMTQVASPAAVRGNFNHVELELDGDKYLLDRRGDEFWVEMPDPNAKLIQTVALKNAPRVSRRVSMLTGSHYMQAYWVDNQHGNQQFSLPFTYLFEQERWVPRRSVFIMDPAQTNLVQLWNVGCVDCHSTAGQPRQAQDGVTYDTRVAELGIACEACHGPGEEHVRLNSNPLRRYALHQKGGGDPSIANPGRMSPKRASAVCGRCHSVHAPQDEEAWLTRGEGFKPGEDLEAKMNLIRHPKSPEARRALFWSDGMIRVSGRDYNGLVRSPCYVKGELSCLSCHSMHNSPPVYQVTAGMESNAACVRCHEKIGRNVAGHTHHAAGSSGDLCYNCHMPYTTYGLVKSIRSHEISSPSADVDVATGRPTACNLCHLDKTLGWTSEMLGKWYGIRSKPLDEDRNHVSEAVLCALKGDAGQRAMIGWHLGWEPARAVSGTYWITPYLVNLLEDEYPAVRYISQRSLAMGGEHSEYDFIAPANSREKVAKSTLESWLSTRRGGANTAVLIGPDGSIDEREFRRLLLQRDRRVMELNE